MRWLWVSFGLIALGLGAIGIVTPLLPTVPFLLLAAFCFSKSSERLHNWLISHKILGPPIETWRRSGAIGRRAKWFATLSMAAAFMLSVIFAVGPLILTLQAITLSLVALFIWSRPEA